MFRLKRSRFLSALVTLGLIYASWNCNAAGLLSLTESGQLGMVETWRESLSLVGGQKSIIDQQIWVDRVHLRKFVEITVSSDGNKQALTRISADRLNRRGQQIGITEAQRLADLQIVGLKRRKLDVTKETITVPQVRIITLGSDGTVESRDAETGQLYWATRWGDPNLPYGPLGINDHFIIFTNGSKLIQLSAENGYLVARFNLAGAPLYGAVILDRYGIVPTVGGRIEGSYLTHEVGEDASTFFDQVQGNHRTRPIQLTEANRIAWSTDTERIVVMEAFPDSPRRPASPSEFYCDGVVHGTLGQGTDDRLFFATDVGQVYATGSTASSDASLTLHWKRGLGEAVYKSPFVTKDRIFIVTVFKNLICLDAQTGQKLWTQPARRISAVLAMAGERLFVRNHAHQLAVLDVATGDRLASFSNVSGSGALVNQTTDRLYLTSAGGTLQCIRPAETELPYFLSKRETGSDDRNAGSTTLSPASNEDKSLDFDSELNNGIEEEDSFDEEDPFKDL